MDLVDKEENRKIVLEAIASVFGGPVELELGLNQNLNPGLQKTSLESEERKTVYNDKKLKDARLKKMVESLKQELDFTFV